MREKQREKERQLRERETVERERQYGEKWKSRREKEGGCCPLLSAHGQSQAAPKAALAAMARDGHWPPQGGES